MFCSHCGKEISSSASFCESCGAPVKSAETLNTANENVQAQVNAKNSESKLALGLILGFFTGLIGLIVGFGFFAEGTVARKTFLKGWLIAFCIEIGISVLFSILVYSGVIDIFAMVPDGWLETEPVI